jgi:hypothetical protein
MMDDLIEKTPAVIRSVQAALPDHYPEDLGQAIFQGLQACANRLAA